MIRRRGEDELTQSNPPNQKVQRHQILQKLIQEKIALKALSDCFNPVLRHILPFISRRTPILSKGLGKGSKREEHSSKCNKSNSRM